MIICAAFQILPKLHVQTHQARRVSTATEWLRGHGFESSNCSKWDSVFLSLIMLIELSTVITMWKCPGLFPIWQHNFVAYLLLFSSVVKYMILPDLNPGCSSHSLEVSMPRFAYHFTHSGIATRGQTWKTYFTMAIAAAGKEWVNI